MRFREIISYPEMVQREGLALQKGMKIAVQTPQRFDFISCRSMVDRIRRYEAAIDSASRASLPHE